MQIWLVLHELNFLSTEWTTRFLQAQTRNHGCLHRCAVLHTKVPEHINDVLALGQCNGACGAIALDFDTEEPAGWPKVTQLEVPLRLYLYVLDALLRLANGTTTFLPVLSSHR